MNYPECNECKCHSCAMTCARNNCRMCDRLHAEQSAQLNVTLVCRQYCSICDVRRIAKKARVARKGGMMRVNQL